jgi:hypothetical protein
MGGRPPFLPTDEQRENVGAMVGYGLPLEKICRLIRNPQTGKPVDEKTLRKAFPHEIETGRVTVEALVSGFIVNSILGRKGGIANETARATLAQFFAKTQMGWKEVNVHEHGGKDGSPSIMYQLSKDDANL